MIAKKRLFWLPMLLLGLASAAQAAEQYKIFGYNADQHTPQLDIDIIVAVIETETISLADIRFERLILMRTRKWFTRTTPRFWPTEKDALEELTGRILLYNQARRMGFGDVPDSEVDARLAEFRKTFPDDGDKTYREWLLTYEATDPVIPLDHKDLSRFRPLRKRFYHELVIEKYLNKKINVQVRIELEKYFTKNQSRLAKKYATDDQDLLREMAREELITRKLSQHVHELEERFPVILLLDINKDLDRAAYAKIKEEKD